MNKIILYFFIVSFSFNVLAKDAIADDNYAIVENLSLDELDSLLSSDSNVDLQGPDLSSVNDENVKSKNKQSNKDLESFIERRRKYLNDSKKNDPKIVESEIIDIESGVIMGDEDEKPSVAINSKYDILLEEKARKRAESINKYLKLNYNISSMNLDLYNDLDSVENSHLYFKRYDIRDQMHMMIEAIEDNNLLAVKALIKKYPSLLNGDYYSKIYRSATNNGRDNIIRYFNIIKSQHKSLQ